MAEPVGPGGTDGAGEEALEELRERHQRFVRSIAHDVRNPLQVILLQAERLQRLCREPGSRERRAADAIAAAVRELDALIRDRVQEARREGEASAGDAGGATGDAGPDVRS